MAKVDDLVPVGGIHGKIKMDDDGYFYMTQDGKQHYRKRKETYQQNQSPKQKWNSAAFRWAHKAVAEEKAAIGEGAIKWNRNKRFAELQREWKEAHPYEEWYAAYLEQVSEDVATKTSAEEVSEYMLKKQIDVLTEQLAELQRQLREKKG